VPGQRFRAAILLLESDKALTVPNIALTTSGDATSVTVRDGSRSEVRAVRLGVRGPSRTEVLEGLKSGDTIVLGTATTAAPTGKPAPPTAAAPAASKAP
jgi:hypothetical protein